MFKFKKIASILASTAMLSSTVALAAAANYPQPFVTNGAANVAVVYGSNPAATVDLVGVIDIQDSLNSFITTTTTTSTYSCGDADCVLIAKSSDNLNLGNNWGVFTGTISDDDLSNLLADGTYIADDNDEFNYEQKITLGTPNLTHFRDSDYEELAGLDDRTPTVGFKIPANTFIMNYTLDFTTDAETDLVSNDADDIEGSDLPLLGKTYYVSNMDEQTGSIFMGKTTLLDSAVRGTVVQGETATVTSGGTTYEVTIDFIDADEVVYMVNGERAPASGKLTKGSSFRLDNDAYIGVIDISRLEVSGETGSSTFSIGSGKLEITSDAEVKLNDDAIEGVKGYIYGTTSNTSTTNKIDKIEIEWISGDEIFLGPNLELTLPGFEAVKFAMNDLVRSEEEKILIQNDGDTSVELTLPIKDGTVSLNLLYANTSGEFIGIGKAADELLATVEPNQTKLTFWERANGNDYHSYFVASYNISGEAESALVRAKVSYDSTSARNETTIEKNVDGTWTTVCDEKSAGDTCDVTNLITLTISEVNHTSAGNESVVFTAGTNVNFQTIYTAGGMRIYLPFITVNGTGGNRWGNMNVTANIGAGDSALFTTAGWDQGNWSHQGTGTTLAKAEAGNSPASWALTMYEEDKDDNIAAGRYFNVTIDDNSDGNVHVTQLDEAGSGGSQGLEIGTGTSIYEAYITSDVATRIIHYTKPDEDYMEVYYPSGDSESYAEVFLTEVGAAITGGSGGGTGTVGAALKDTEIASAAGKNIVVVGGSCVNSVAASLLGVSSPTCGDAWMTSTNVGAGQFLIQTFDRAGGKVATLVAGYNAADTQNAAKYLTTQTVDTTVGKKYVGTTATSASLVVE